MALSGQKKYHKTNPRPGSGPSVSKASLKAFQARAMELVEPVLRRLGLETVLAQCQIEGGRPVLRVFIDRIQVSDSGLDASQVSLDDCAAASRALDEILEADQGPQPDGYVLELSSPGLDRPLVRETDFIRFQGRLVKLKLRQAGKNSSHKGRLSQGDQGAFILESPDGSVSFRFEDVVSCRLSLDDISF